MRKISKSKKKEELYECEVCGKKKCVKGEPMCEDCYMWIRYGEY